MNLHEYQSKRIFATYGIPSPQGEVATTPAEARAIAERLGGPVVIKSQVLVGGRGKAGGIKVAKSVDEAEQLAGQILGMNIKGLTVKKVLVDEAANIATEIYLGAVLDRAQRRVVLMASSEGGVEIEEVAKHTPDKIIKVAVHPFLGLRDYQALELADGIGLPKEHLNAFIPLILSPRNILVKKISGNEVKCRDLLRYFRAYVDIFQVCSNYFTVSLYFEPYHLPFKASFPF